MISNQEIKKLVDYLAKGNQQLADEVISEIKELLITEDREGWKVNTQNTLRFAFELDRMQPVEQLPSRVATRNFLMNGSSNKQLINQLFASTGI